MKLGYAILYVPDVAAAVASYEGAFGLERRLIHESGQYAEMEAGASALGFASEAMAEGDGIAIRLNTPRDVAASAVICLVTDTPDEAYARAVASGASPVKPVELKSWGQKVSYVHDLNGCLVELCSPVPPR